MRFSLAPADCPSRIPDTAPDHLFIFLHGYGADGNDLIDLSQYFDHVLPNAAFLSPHAPGHTPFGGRQWFPLSDLSPREIGRGAETAREALNDFIDSALAHFNLSGDRLILAGFSQGAMMTLDVGLRRKTAPRALIGYSGALPLAEKLREEIQCKPPVLLCHGDADSVVPYTETENAYKRLIENAVPVRKLIVPDCPHTIAPAAMEESLQFIALAEAR